MNAPKNLWGELPLAEVIRTPVVILREQANQLTELTNGILQGDVQSVNISSNNKPFFLRLNIIAPALEGYIMSILAVQHTIMLYPLSLSDDINGVAYQCSNESEFTATVAEVLSSSAVHKVVAALLSQSRSEQVF